MNDLFDWLTDEAEEHFVKSYVEDCDSEKIAAETLGLKIARHFEWDGEKIAHFLIRALYSGLEDANWHTEAGVFYTWDEEMSKGTAIGKLLKDEINNIAGSK